MKKEFERIIINVLLKNDVTEAREFYTKNEWNCHEDNEEFRELLYRLAAEDKKFPMRYKHIAIYKLREKERKSLRDDLC